MSDLLPGDADAMVDEQALSAASGLSISKLRSDRCLRQGIPFIKIGACVRYRVGDYRDYVSHSRVETGQK